MGSAFAPLDTLARIKTAEKTPGQKRRGKDKDAAKAVPHSLTIDQKTKLIQEVLEDQKKHLHGVQDEANSMVFDLQVELDSKDESMSIINLEMIALKQVRYDATRYAIVCVCVRVAMCVCACMHMHTNKVPSLVSLSLPPFRRLLRSSKIQMALGKARLLIR